MKNIESIQIEKLIDIAMSNLKYSYAPYSDFWVSAVLLSINDDIFTGVNIENAAYTPTNCAERTAFFKAVSQGITKFKAIVIVAGKKGLVSNYCAPCGVCRQVMMEFCDPNKFIIILAKNNKDYKIFTLKELLPMGFGKDDM